MVGVAGKFKGCNTCRTRRVKCDNLRPHCKKCIDSGRECAGYDRERVFIVGTARDQGRCSSHPHRNLMGGGSRKGLLSKRKKHAGGPNSGSDGKHNGESRAIRYLAIQTELSTLKQVFGADGTGTAFTMGSTSLDSPNSISKRMQDRGFTLRGACLLSLDAHGPEGETSLSHPTSTCVFLYDLGSSTHRCSMPLKAEPGLEYHQACCSLFNILGGTAEEVRAQGPTRYTSFPSHQFFSRVFRPHLCFHALNHRYPTFLAESDWCSIPWQTKSKSPLDNLFDILVLLPEIFARGEELETHHPNITRRLHAKELLERCTVLEQRFEAWLGKLNTQDETPSWWEDRKIPRNISDTYYPMNEKPFDTNLQFRDIATAEMMLYYWAGQCCFYRAVQHIHSICAAEFTVSTSPEVERLSFTDATSTSPSIEFTPPQQRQVQDLLFGADWNQHSFMPISTTEQVVSPIYGDPAMQYSQYLPDFTPESAFPADIPLEFGYETAGQSFLPSAADYANFLPVTRAFTEPYSPATSSSQIYSYDPTPFIIPATPTINTNLPTSFPLIPRSSSLTYPTLSPTYTSNPSPSSRHNSASFSRAHSFSLSHPHPPSYIHSRSPTPTHTAISSAPSSNPSLRNSISNPGSNPNSTGNGYTSTPPPQSHLPTSTSHPSLVDLGLDLDMEIGGAGVAAPAASMSMMTSVPVLDAKFTERSVAEIAGRIARAVPFLLGGSTSMPTSARLESRRVSEIGGYSGYGNGNGNDNSNGNDWQGGGSVGIALREAGKVFRRQGRTAEADWCRRVLGMDGPSIDASIAADVGRRVWREWRGI